MGLAWGRMGLAWGYHGVSMGLAWGWHGHGVSMGLAWGWYGVGMGLAWAEWGRMGINPQEPWHVGRRQQAPLPIINHQSKPPAPCRLLADPPLLLYFIFRGAFEVLEIQAGRWSQSQMPVRSLISCLLWPVVRGASAHHLQLPAAFRSPRAAENRKPVPSPGVDGASSSENDQLRGHTGQKEIIRAARCFFLRVLAWY
jgi:hypothetical protein